MKYSKLTRAFAGVAALAMSVGAFALAAGTAQAADGDAAATKPGITITGAVAGHEFKAYRLATYGNVGGGVNGSGQDGIVYGQDGVISSTALRTVADLNAAVKTAAEDAAKANGGAGDPKSETLPTQYKLAADGSAGAAITDNPAGWVASWDTTTDAKALKQFAAELAKSDAITNATPNATATGAADAQSVTLSSYDTGYYLVTDTQGDPILVGSTLTGYAKLGAQDLGKAVVKTQLTVPAPTKTVDKQSLSVGGNANEGYATFTVIGKLPNTTVPTGFTYRFVDVPAAGLDLDPTGFAAYIQDTNADGTLKVDAKGEPVFADAPLKARTDYVRPAQVKGDGTAAFTVQIRNVDKKTPGAAVKLQYRGYIDAAAQPAYKGNVAKFGNTVHVEYTDPDAATTAAADASATLKSTAAAAAEIQTFKGFEFTKISAKDSTPLAGAEFTIAPKADEANNNAYVANARAKSVSADQTGKVVFSGLAAGTYTVTETQVPDGYYANVRPSFKVVIDALGGYTIYPDEAWDLVDNSHQDNVTVKNVNQINQLPTTGGAGLAFITAAIVLAAGGSVFFAAKFTRNRRLTRA